MEAAVRDEVPRFRENIKKRIAMGRSRSSIILLLLFFLLSSSVFATELLFFYEKGCPYSAKIDDFLQRRIKPNYPIEVKAYEIHEPGAAKLMLDLARAYGAKDILKKGTPAVFIGENAFQGRSRLILRQVEEAVRTALKQKAPSPLSRLGEESQEEKFRTGITLPALVGAALANAINPCAGAVLVLLLGTILVASKRRKAVLGAGFSFTVASFISYFLIGIGLFSTVQSSGIQHLAYIVVSILAVLIGLWNMKDFFLRRHRLSIEELPKGWEPLIKRSTSKATPVLGASLVGLAASLFLLPCTSGPYIVIIGMLANTASQMQAIWLLLLYNSIFVLPFIIITLAVGLGFTSASQVETWRREKLRRLRLITGAVMFALGVMLIIFLLLGIL
jgi:cytochrome c biogenesis protein CcdA